jgi:carbon-monoxide dehydrogenase small subunit
MLISAYALLRDNPQPSEYEVKKGIEGNICRCTGYVKIIEAILDAAERIEPE